MSAKVFGLDKIFDKLESINLADSEIQTILEESADIALPVMRQELKNAIGNDSTGELVAALGKSPVKLNGNGIFNIKIGFREPRSDGKSNALVANVLEFGKSGQPARPWLARSLRKVRKQVTAHIQESIDDRISK